MWPFGHKRREPEASLPRLNQLEIRVEQLELASAERHVAVLNAVEKVLHQLKARARKRDDEKPLDDDLQGTIERVPLPLSPPLRRMRGF